MKKKFAIIENSQKQSRKKAIFDYIIEKSNINLCTESMYCDKDGFQDLIDSLRSSNYYGAQVSSSFKTHAFSVADLTTERAISCKMANTLTFSDGRIYADNTYGHSIVSDIENNLGITLSEKKVIIISSNNNMFTCLLSEIEKRDIKQIFLASRSPEKISSILEENDQLSPHTFSIHIDDIEGLFDVIINTTNVIFSEKNNPFSTRHWAKGALAYDINISGSEYNHFLESAKSENITTRDGTGFMIEQAVESISVWVGEKIERSFVKELIESITNKTSSSENVTTIIKLLNDRQQAQQSI
ncbi:hypothetical protein [Candidatus Ichthyocystis hellenicum]|uniref:hypothetical protein n=1 Tax=Candidatus Ichthyocystis hellenicum TaxID=1561003 RepID=UPI000B874CDE|nr:hypothetical protein [Candidatus Ichthyocystis hellenicum]